MQEKNTNILMESFQEFLEIYSDSILHEKDAIGVKSALTNLQKAIGTQGHIEEFRLQPFPQIGIFIGYQSRKYYLLTVSPEAVTRKYYIGDNRILEKEGRFNFQELKEEMGRFADPINNLVVEMKKYIKNKTVFQKNYESLSPEEKTVIINIKNQSKNLKTENDFNELANLIKKIRPSSYVAKIIRKELENIINKFNDKSYYLNKVLNYFSSGDLVKWMYKKI